MKLKTKKVKARIKTIRAIPYKGNMVYLRMIDGEIFEWLLVFNNQIYSSYLIITPKKGQTKLSEAEIMASARLVLAGATTTIDTLLGEKISKEDQEKVRLFKEAGRKAGLIVN